MNFDDSYDLTDEDIEVIRTSIMPSGTNDSHLKLFLMFCKQMRFHPMLGHVWAKMRKGRLMFGIGLDGYLSYVHNNPKFRGFTSPRLTLNKGGKAEILAVEHYLPGQGVIVSATIGIRHADDPEPTEVTCLFDEFADLDDQGRPQFRWATAPVTQIVSAAIRACVRRRFPGR